MRVLIVEDEVELAEMLAEGLRGEGMVCNVAHDGARALEMTAAATYDVLVLDRDLPHLSGDSVCRALNTAGYPARIMMLTAAGSLPDLIDGLGQGADDYMAKPFSYLELVARLRALARRASHASAATVLSRHGVSLDTVRRVAERDGRPLKLTPRRNTGDLGCLPAGRLGLGRSDQGHAGSVRPGRIVVLGAFELPVGHLAFDDARAGAQPPGCQEPFADLMQGRDQCPGQPGGGKMPPGQ
ncbi:response regulator transcription factor [Streptomyces sp. NPDC058525]|uniref:response regulator transcription factor n=1 Tax=Streptomyces sp. NPDC058525 TaxID=3346538 RepID=UPI00366916B1